MEKIYAFNDESDYSLNARSLDLLDQSVDKERKNNNSMDKKYRLPVIKNKFNNADIYFDMSQTNPLAKNNSKLN